MHVMSGWVGSVVCLSVGLTVMTVLNSISYYCLPPPAPLGPKPSSWREASGRPSSHCTLRHKRARRRSKR